MKVADRKKLGSVVAILEAESNALRSKADEEGNWSAYADRINALENAAGAVAYAVSQTDKASV
jgi:hypothetical protein